jgi:hypothetical protein
MPAGYQDLAMAESARAQAKLLEARQQGEQVSKLKGLQPAASSSAREADAAEEFINQQFMLLKHLKVLTEELESHLQQQCMEAAVAWQQQEAAKDAASSSSNTSTTQNHLLTAAVAMGRGGSSSSSSTTLSESAVSTELLEDHALLMRQLKMVTDAIEINLDKQVATMTAAAAWQEQSAPKTTFMAAGCQLSTAVQGATATAAQPCQEAPTIESSSAASAAGQEHQLRATSAVATAASCSEQSPAAMNGSHAATCCSIGETTRGATDGRKVSACSDDPGSVLTQSAAASDGASTDSSECLQSADSSSSSSKLVQRLCAFVILLCSAVWYKPAQTAPKPAACTSTCLPALQQQCLSMVSILQQLSWGLGKRSGRDPASKCHEQQQCCDAGPSGSSFLRPTMQPG